MIYASFYMFLYIFLVNVVFSYIGFLKYEFKLYGNPF